MFIEINELNSVLDENYINEITQGDELLLIDVIETAEEEMRGYLAKYDVQAIFNAKGKERNKLLVQFCKDIAIYNLIELDQSGVDVAARTKRYERAITWLKQANETVLSSLPMAASKTAANLISYTSKEKNNNYFD